MHMENRVASKWLRANSEAHQKSVALMKFLSSVARRLGVAEHVYVVGGAVRNWLLDKPIKDIDVVIDSVSLGGNKNSDWFAAQVQRSIPTLVDLTTNQYGVAILTVKGPWILDGIQMQSEVIEIANARKESYSGAGGKGKGYKPTDVQPATIDEDVYRREFTFNTLLWKLLDLADGPDRAQIIDITGLGRSHLEQRLVVTPLDPDRTFSDDPTRMLRAIKFIVKYNLRLDPEVAESIRRNAARLDDMPWEAVGKILVDDILAQPGAIDVLHLMDDLGLLSEIADMVRLQKPFAMYLARQMREIKNVALFLRLAHLGLASSTPVGFLSESQRERLSQVIVQMSPDEAHDFLEKVKSPPIDNLALIEEFHLQPKDRGILAPMAREILLESPGLSPEQLTNAVRSRMR